MALGPQYGTVSPSFIKSAAKEAIRAVGIDLLCVLGFAFDPQATGITEDDGVTVDGQVIVELRGVNVYDPTTGEIRNNDTGQIALWTIPFELSPARFTTVGSSTPWVLILSPETHLRTSAATPCG